MDISQKFFIKKELHIKHDKNEKKKLIRKFDQNVINKLNY